MIKRILAFLTDLILFLFVYCFLFVSIIILLFDRNTDYTRFMPAFYIIMGVLAYGYFILPILLFGKTLGKRIFGISLKDINGWKSILFVHIKYIVFRLFPIVAVLLLLQGYGIVVQVVLGLWIIYPVFDYIYLKVTETSFTDTIFQLNVNVY